MGFCSVLSGLSFESATNGSRELYVTAQEWIDMSCSDGLMATVQEQEEELCLHPYIRADATTWNMLTIISRCILSQPCDDAT
jgi:hypothetical protein